MSVAVRSATEYRMGSDLYPAVLELAGFRHLCQTVTRTGRWRERTVAGMRGKSWMSYFHGGKADEMAAIHNQLS
jgi:hypothetical protein